MIASFPVAMRRIALWCCVVLLFCCALATPSVSAAGQAPLRAYYLQDIPSSYAAKEKLILSLGGTGAGAVIIDLPLSKEGMPQYHRLPNIVYLVHKARLKIIVLLPVRNYPGLLVRHPEWEDVQYDPKDCSHRPSGTLDLFNTEVVLYLNELARQVASFSVDGIFLGKDFMLGPGEGLSRTARQNYEGKTGVGIDCKRLFNQGGAGGYKQLFWRWEEVKVERLLQVYDWISRSARSMNSSLSLGVPAPVVLPISVPEEVLARYSYDMQRLKSRNIDYYWTLIPYRDMKDRQGLGYYQRMEITARTAFSVVTTVQDPSRAVIAFEATSRDGRMLPLSEMEEARHIIRNAGNTGLAFGILSDTIVPGTFMQKMFRQDE